MGLTIGNRGKTGQWVILGAAASLVIFFGVYGYFVEATVRIGFSVYQVPGRSHRADHVHHDRHLPVQGGARHWVDQLGKDSRARPIRLDPPGRHVYLANGSQWDTHAMPFDSIGTFMRSCQDTSVDAFSPTLGFAALVISVCVLLFLGLIGFIFWLGSLGEKKPIAPPTAMTPETVPASD